MKYVLNIVQSGNYKVVEAYENQLLIRVLENNNYAIYTPCGGKGTCGKCKVRIKEKKSSDDDGYYSREKTILSCQYRVNCDADVFLDDNYTVSILTNTIKGEYTIDPINKSNYKNHPGEKYYGVAFDIGTTTVVGYLLDLGSGEILGSVSKMNPQGKFGSDVISRITYTIENEDGKEQMNTAICDLIALLIEEIAVQQNINISAIVKISIVGNTTMLHFLMGLDAKGIAVAPFTPANLKEVKTTLAELSIFPKGLSNCEVLILPCISSYVGADVTSAILASGMTKGDELCLLIDIGTNGEIALGNKNGLITCSTAAGPAFEGATIKHGIGGVDGAIDKVRIDDGEITITTINGKDPVGICGSGIIDAVSELLRNGVVDETGRMLSKDEVPPEYSNHLVGEGKDIEFVLYSSNGGKRIAITAKDIREIQLAKAAISAGVKVLLKNTNRTFEDIDLVFLAGGFGNYIDKESAINIGLIEMALKNKIVAVGNAAGAGAIEVLFSDRSYKDALRIAKDSKYIELSNSKEFNEVYIESMLFNN